MSNVVEKTRCPVCAAVGNDNHGDNLAVYDDGSTYCFACETAGHMDDVVSSSSPEELPEKRSPKFPPVPYKEGELRDWRKIATKTFDKYGCVFKGDTLYYPYDKNGSAYKMRNLKKKEFRFFKYPNTNLLFGLHVFPRGGKEVFICEGELDALTVHQITGSPSVGVAGTAFVNKTLKTQDAYDFLMSFDVIKIVFDNDEAGQKAAEEALSLFPPYKACLVDLGTYNDPNEAYNDSFQGIHMLNKALSSAKPKRPKNILRTIQDYFKALVNESSTPVMAWPFKKLDMMTDGVRAGEFVYVLADTGIGKTTLMRAFEYQALETTEYNIGIFHLEERPGRVLDGIIGQYEEVPIHLREVNERYTIEDKQKILMKVMNNRPRVKIFSIFGGHGTEETLNLIRYMAVGEGCKFIFIDHTSILVSGAGDTDERINLDKLTTDLAVMASELDIAIIAVHHTNDDGRARGSRNIEKVAHTLIYMSRNVEAEDETERNTMHLVLRKARYTGDTGPAGSLLYNKDKGLLEEIEQHEMNTF